MYDCIQNGKVQILDTDLENEIRRVISVLSEPSDWADAIAYMVYGKIEPKTPLVHDMPDELYSYTYYGCIDIPHEEIKPLQIESKHE